MKKFFCFLTILLYLSGAFGQNKTAESSDKITDKQTLELPRRKLSKPKLQMQKAMKLMKNFIEKEKIDTSDYYLWQVKLIQYGSENNKKSAWHFWWLNIDGGLGNYIEILVFMNGNVGRVPSM
jgi:hypothetical protein